MTFHLRHLVFAAFTLVAAIPVALLAFWIHHWSLSQELQAVQEKHLLVARNLTHALSRYTRDVQAVFSYTAKVLASEGGHAGDTDLLNRMQIRHLWLLDGQLHIERQVHVDHSVQGHDLPKDLAQLVALYRQSPQGKAGEVMFTPVMRTSTGEPAMYLLRDEPGGQLALAILGMDYVRELQRSIAFGDRGHAAIVDQTGQVLAHPLDSWREEMKDISFLPPVQAMLRGETGVTTFYTPAMKADMIAGHTTVPQVGWGVMIPQPMEELEARAAELWHIALGIAVAGMVIAAWAGWRLSDRMARPILSVARAARAAADGALLSRVEPEQGIAPSEIRDLSQAFNHMVDEIGSKTTAIEAFAHRLADAQRIASLGNWEWRPDDGTLWYSDEVARLFGYPADADQLDRQDLLDRIHPDDQPRVERAAQAALANGYPYDIEYRVVWPDGSTHYLYQESELSGDEGSKQLRLVSTVLDVTERKHHEQQLQRQANYDELTGLANRSRFLRRLNLALDRARTGDRRLALLHVDLDNFKAVNNTLGHAVGDQLLEMAADRLRTCVPPDGELARLGGDEFMVLCDAALAEQMTDAISAHCDRPFGIQGYELALGCSIGITVFPDDADESGAMLRNANMALVAAKSAGHDIQYFTAAMGECMQRRAVLGNALRNALERGEFAVHYQPIVAADSGTIYGAEALLRWQHPELGAVSPAEFIPLAEETGVIGPLGEWVLASACAQARRWNLHSSRPVRVSVNLSIRQLSLGLSAERIAHILEQQELPPELLTLEITESLLLDNADTTLAWLDAVRRLGVQFSMDDFGTGYSSLSYLARIPAAILKLDRSFIRDVATKPAHATLLGAVIALARRMKMTLVAEGVENPEQLAFLRAQQCELIQGYLYSRPVDADAFAALLAAGPIKAGADTAASRQQAG